MNVENADTNEQTNKRTNDEGALSDITRQNCPGDRQFRNSR